MKRILLTATIAFASLLTISAQNVTHNTVKLTHVADQIRFEVPNQNRYWLMSKTAFDNKAFALYSPEDGGWFTYWKEASGDMIVSKGKVGIGTSSPSTKLEIENSGNEENDVVIRSTSTTPGYAAWSRLAFKREGDSNQASIGYYGNNTSGLVMEVTGSNPIRFYNNSAERMRIAPTGNVGIGTTNPNDKLVVNGNVRLGKDDSNGLLISKNSGTLTDIPGSGGAISFTGPIHSHIVFDVRGNDTHDGFYVRVPSTLQLSPVADKTALAVKASGKVGIGTTNPDDDALLTVAGAINSKEVQVKIDAGSGPDYVFEEDYNLISLEETKAYIESNKHLPEVPSAKEMEANGVELGNMSMILLKKIEEMTLHQIKLMEEVKALKAKVKELEK